MRIWQGRYIVDLMSEGVVTVPKDHSSYSVHNNKGVEHLYEWLCLRLGWLERQDNRLPIHKRIDSIDISSISIETFWIYLSEYVDFHGLSHPDSISLVALVLCSSPYAAICHLFNLKGLSVPLKLIEYVKSRCELLAGGVPTSEKRPVVNRMARKSMPFNLYEYLSMDLLCSPNSDHIWMHGYAILLWNLGRRCSVVSSIQVSKIHAYFDCISFGILPPAANQAPLFMDRPFHFYANPEAPHLCPFLALAIQLSYFGCGKDNQLFAGNHQSKRFGWNFTSYLKQKESVLKSDYDLQPADIGVSSFYQGAHDYIGDSQWPHAQDAFFARTAGRSRVISSSSHYSLERDCCLGRLLSGLPFLTPSFMILPPRFHPDAAVDTDIEACFPAVSPNRLHFIPVLRILLASLVYHADWIYKHVDKASPLRAKLPYSSPQMIARLSKSLLSPYSYEDHLSPTGIPPEMSHIPSHSAGRHSADSPSSPVKSSARKLRNSTLRKPKKDWKLPSVCLTGGWELWWLGDRSLGVLPFRELDIQSDIPASQRKLFYEWRSVFRRLESALRSRALIPEVVDENAVGKMFLRLIPLLSKVCGSSSRLLQLTVATVARKVRQSRELFDSMCEETL